MISIIQRMATGVVFVALGGCVASDTQDSHDLGVKVLAKCGNCDTCELHVDGIGSKVVDSKKVDVADPDKSD